MANVYLAFEVVSHGATVGVTANTSTFYGLAALMFIDGFDPHGQLELPSQEGRHLAAKADIIIG